MKIQFLTSAHNSLSQRLMIELTGCGHQVIVTLATNEKTMVRAVDQHSPDLIIAPSSEDAHQDHRTIGELVPTVFRDQLYLAYEIPKWDGDMSRPSMYVPLPAGTAHRKVELLHKCFPSQRDRDWWDDEVFLGLARLRGMECRARYAEAFRCAKSVIVPSAPTLGTSREEI